MSYRYITGPELSTLIQQGSKVGKDIAIVDVRDQDFAGGNIPGATRAPAEEFTEQTADDLVKKLEGVPKVVFHCALSQVRGPKAARKYATALAASQPEASTTDEPESKQSFSPNPYGKDNGAQEVLVLREGFTGWQSLYRDNPLLVEKWDKNVWGEYAR